jgi:drug/metabolite transporter (DMT)-like permease
MLAGCAAFAVMGCTAHLLHQEQHCDWQIIAVARAALPLTFALLLARAAGVRLVLWRPRTLWIRSLAGSVSMVCTFYALTRLPVSQVLTVTQMFPIWIALLSWPLAGEAPGRLVWLAVVSAVLGVFVLHDPQAVEGNLATGAAAVASLLTAVALLGLHRLRYLDPWAIVVHFSAVALVFCLATAFAFERRIPLERLLAARPLLLLLTLGVSATAGQLFLTRAFATGSPSAVSVVGLTQIVFALPLDVFWLGKSFHPWGLLGLLLIVAPTACLMIFRPAAGHATPEDLTEPGAEIPQGYDAG